MKKANQEFFLYYICHKDNLKSILQEGIYSHNKVAEEGIESKSIHDKGVIARRDKVIPLTGKNLQTYTNLYFQPRNAMLYRLIKTMKKNELVVLQIKPSVIEIKGVCFSDRNAAVSRVSFRNDMKEIDFEIFKGEFGLDSNGTKEKMMAEALVPDVVPPEYIMGIHVEDESHDAVKKIAGDIPISANYRMFFLPEYRRKIRYGITLAKGDMFYSSMQTFTISVNIKGIMGKGLASRTKYQFPDAYVQYQDDCKNKKLKIGKPTLYKRDIRIEEELADDATQLGEKILQNGSRWFLFLPTKGDWRNDSNIEDIEKSMQWLLKNYEKEGIKSIALPALGCGLGKLRWQEVGPMMCRYLSKMDIPSSIYLPMEQKISPDFLTEKYLLDSDSPLLKNSRQ